MCEDDISLSPYFYKWLRLVRRLYGRWNNVSGFSLQGQTIKHSNGECCVNVPKIHKLFLYPTVGTTGFSPNNKLWREFLTWYRTVRDKNIPVPLVPNHISSQWFRTMKDSMWEMEYLYYTWKQRQYTVYPNLDGNRGLALNWLEDGLHYQGHVLDPEAEKKGLVLQWKPEYENMPLAPVIVNNNGDIISKK